MWPALSTTVLFMVADVSSPHTPQVNVTSRNLRFFDEALASFDAETALASAYDPPPTMFGLTGLRVGGLSVGQVACVRGGGGGT